MSPREDRRADTINLMAEHVLSKGLASATLRPLAIAAGTSDRMLLYYFADKDELLTAVLETIADRLRGELDEAIPISTPRPFDRLLQDVWAVLGSARHRSYMHIWYELAAAAARGLHPHREVAGVIADQYLTWVQARLEPEADGRSARLAPLFLATLQGMYLLDAIGRPGIAGDATAQLLSRQAETPGAV